jgi:hypothetical protein
MRRKIRLAESHHQKSSHEIPRVTKRGTKRIAAKMVMFQVVFTDFDLVTVESGWEVCDFFSSIPRLPGWAFAHEF